MKPFCIVFYLVLNKNNQVEIIYEIMRGGFQSSISNNHLIGFQSPTIV